MAAQGSGPRDQFVLEHQRGDAHRAGDVQPPGQLRGVDRGLEGAQRGLDLAGVINGKSALDSGDPRDGFERVGPHDADRQVAAEPLDQGEHAFVRLDAECQHDAGQGDLPGDVHAVGGYDQIGPVARRDDQRTVAQMVQKCWYGRATDDDRQDITGVRLGAAEQTGGMQRVADLGYGRSGDGRDVRNREDRNAAKVIDGRQRRACGRIVDAVRNDGDLGRAQVDERVEGAANRCRD